MKTLLVLLLLFNGLWCAHVELTHEAELDSAIGQMIAVSQGCRESCRRYWEPKLEECRRRGEMLTQVSE